MENTIASQSRVLLSKLTHSWEKRARVKHTLLPNEITYETDKPDFLESLIPIKNCQAYQLLSIAQKQSLLSYAWLAYNAKTIAIESKIISPVCYDIMDGHVPGTDDNEIRSLISETLTDESYHVLLCHHAMAMTEKHRHISRHIFPDFDLIEKVSLLEKQYDEHWQKILVRLAVAIVSEVFISDYLEWISTSFDVVTLNRETVRTHRMDEMIHGKIFVELSKKIYHALSPKQKDFFASILHYPVFYFASKEINVWRHILDAVCPEFSAEICEELITQEWYDLSRLDYHNVIMLAEEMNMRDFTRYFDAVIH